MQHLFILWVLIEGDYGHSVVQLERKGVDRVVDDHDVLQITISKNSQVFDIVALQGLHATIPVQSVLDQLSCGVDVIQNCISIRFVRSSEHNDLKILVRLSQAIIDVGSDVDSCVYWLVLIGKLDWNNDLWLIVFNVVHTMNQSLIHIENDKFCF